MPSERVPLVSIMLPAQDAANTLRAAAESCLNQTLTDLELLLIENDSTKETVEVMEKMASSDPRVRIVRTPPGAGFIAALNTGWKASRGRFLVRMDADDFSYPLRVELQVKMLNDQRQLAACGTGVRILRRGTSGELLSPLQGFADYENWLNSVTSPEAIWAERFIDSPVANPSAMLRREVFEQIGGYRVVDWAEDYDFWLRALEAGLQIAKVPDVLLDWIDSDSRMTRNDEHYSQRQFLNAKAHFLARMSVVLQSRVGILGAGPIGKRLAQLLLTEGVDVTTFYEVNERRIGNEIHGIPVSGSGDLRNSSEKDILISAVGVTGGRERVRQLLAPLGYIEGENFFCVA